MDETMTRGTEPTMRTAEPAPLGFGGAFARQLRLLWMSRRPLLLIVALLALLALSGEPWNQDPLTRLLTLWPLWLVVIGPIWGVAVFHNEGPSKRLYHWSMPVNRTQHTLARLAAGLAWLWVAFAILILAGIAMAAAAGELWQLGEISAAGWVNFFTGPLMGYLAISVLTVGSDYPLRWFFGLIFLVPLTLSLMDEWLGLRSVVETLMEPLGAEWGFFPVMIVGLGDSVMRLQNQITGGTGPTNQFSVEYWWVAMPLWILGIGAIVGIMAARHPDTLPRIRRWK